MKLKYKKTASVTFTLKLQHSFYLSLVYVCIRQETELWNQNIKKRHLSHLHWNCSIRSIFHLFMFAFVNGRFVFLTFIPLICWFAEICFVSLILTLLLILSLLVRWCFRLFGYLLICVFSWFLRRSARCERNNSAIKWVRLLVLLLILCYTYFISFVVFMCIHCVSYSCFTFFHLTFSLISFSVVFVYPIYRCINTLHHLDNN